jgi:hypothetical protein
MVSHRLPPSVNAPLCALAYAKQRLSRASMQSVALYVGGDIEQAKVFHSLSVDNTP